jgi:Rrf2 family iron-sulfur cluster assembly transcriptional regulator
MISQTGRYALRILGHLADHTEVWVQGREIAAATGIPANYLAKILNQLRKRGIVSSQKGWGGGFLLHEEALAAPIADVLELIDGRPDERGCVFELHDCDAEHPCPLHRRWERVRGEFQGMIRSTSIGDLRTAGPR